MTRSSASELPLDLELAGVDRCAGAGRLGRIHRREGPRPGLQALLVLEELQDDGGALLLVVDHLELLDRHPGRRAGLVDPGDERLHPLCRHIGEAHHADEHDRLLSSIDETIYQRTALIKRWIR